jgi:hypothetical protein
MVSPAIPENRYSAFPELLQRSRRDVLERGSRIEARSDPGLFFGKFVLTEIGFPQSRSREQAFRGNIHRPGSEL